MEDNAVLKNPFANINFLCLNYATDSGYFGQTEITKHTDIIIYVTSLEITITDGSVYVCMYFVLSDNLFQILPILMTQEMSVWYFPLSLMISVINGCRIVFLRESNRLSE